MNKFKFILTSIFFVFCITLLNTNFIHADTELSKDLYSQIIINKNTNEIIKSDILKDCVKFYPTKTLLGGGNYDVTYNCYDSNNTLIDSFNFQYNGGDVLNYSLIIYNYNNYIGTVTVDNNLISPLYHSYNTIYINDTTNIYNFKVTGDVHHVELLNYDLVSSFYNKWSYPIESFNIVTYNIANNVINNSYFKYNYDYPVFNLNTNDYLMQMYLTKDIDTYLIIGSNINLSMSNIRNYFTFNKNITIKNITGLTRLDSPNFFYKLIKFKLDDDTSIVRIKSLIDNFNIMPIFIGQDLTRLSDDFAKQWGLDNISSESQEEINENEESQNEIIESNQEINNSIDSLEEQESQFEENFNQSMEDINSDFNIWDSSPKLLSSANFVKEQFDNLTENSPFGDVITFSLTLGLALLLIGKVI